ncbi:hypothetical protein KocCE7_00640 [Kocuria marina subsp. indica]|uniref:hypothetical protein n=1 Tax=Kocuria marina TaxID=223184 RepID=UPI00103FE2C4|nr:hypothetical protein [Kocuria indica]QBJ20533.1 hypothetical protein KocCE7_00640 [Kocuria indica]
MHEAHDPGEEPTEEDEQTERLPPDQVLALRMGTLLGTFSIRQTEILRLVRFMDERANEIDNAARRAKEIISAQLDDAPDEESIEKLIDLLTAQMDESSEDAKSSGLSEEEQQEAFVKALKEIGESVPDGHYATYVESVLRAVRTPPSGEFLRSSLLVTLVGELEMMVNQLARAAVERQPSTLEDSGRTFTWSEISSYDSLADFRDVVVDRAIEDVLRGSLADWMNYFVKKFKIDPVKVADSYDAQETVQRRHCIVHNAGTVSSLYLTKLGPFKRGGEIGDPLDVDSGYLQRAADTLFLVAFALVWSLAVKLCQEDEHRDRVFSELSNRSYFLLQEHRYDLLIRIGQTAPIQRLPERFRLVVQVNVWLAHKLGGQFDTVRQEIESFDVSARSRDFQLARYALLDDYENAARVADSMMRDDELSKAHYLTWPLLAGVREYRRNAGGDSDVEEGVDVS